MSRRAEDASAMSYWVLVTVKDGERTIARSIESVYAQSIKPALVCIVDDGSKDSTPKILKDFEQEPSFHVISLPDRGYDSRRIVHNWNAACEYARKTRSYDFLLISSDDIIFPATYVETLLKEMEADPKLAVVSGSRGLALSDYLSLPEGAGRLIRIEFFESLGYRHPPYYGYEPWLLYKAMQMGYSVKKLPGLTYQHERPFGIGHKFVEYGPAMRCLGYHPLFVLARAARNIFGRGAGISRSASMRMVMDFFFADKWKDDPYYHYFDSDLRSFVRSLQKQRLLRRVS